MKLIFAGTPPFAAAALTSLHRAGHEILLVLTQPDRPAGRGMKLAASAVALEAARLGLPVIKPATLKDGGVQTRLRETAAEVMVVAAYGLILPQAVLDIPKQGCINIHGSLLPRWRGAAPVQRAIEAGDRETGIAIMQMDAGLDTGPVLLERRTTIAAQETSFSLFEKLTQLGAEAIVDALATLPALSAKPQATVGVSYAKKIEKNEAAIDWTQPAALIERRMRAFDPFPGCGTTLDGMELKLWRAIVENVATRQPAGTITAVDDDALIVQCGQQALRVLLVQKPGGKRMTTAELLRGTPVAEGMRFL